MRGTVPAGVSIPLHSHADPKTFLPLSGQLRGLTCHGEQFEWIEIRPGAIFHVPRGAKHAFRTRAGEEAVMIVASTTKIGRFFRELGAPVAHAHAAGRAPPGTSAATRISYEPGSSAKAETMPNAADPDPPAAPSLAKCNSAYIIAVWSLIDTRCSAPCCGT